MPTIQEIGKLAVKQKVAETAFRKACNHYDKEQLNGRDPSTYSYEAERLAFLEASKEFDAACQAYLHEQEASHGKEP